MGSATKSGQWRGASYLDALRPDLGWHVEHAMLASYSADLVAVVAAMLALAGLDDDRGSASKVDFADAIERLTGKLRVVIQSGRLVLPAKPPKILALMDQFIRTVSFDENASSWHPKLALVKTRKDDGDDVEWRLWLGSRNLTRDISWDVGLTLVGYSDDNGKSIPGVVDLGRTMAERAELESISPDSIADELQEIRWYCPDGCDVDSIDLRDVVGPNNSTEGLPQEPKNLRRLLVVSPFLDGTTIKRLSHWGTDSTERTLLSTQIELLKLASQQGRPLDGFDDLLMMASPEIDEAVLQNEDNTEQGQAEASEDEEPEQRGLHAKIIVAEHEKGATMWTGSANATQRGWSGPNSELVARVEISTEVLAGVWAFVKQSATTVEIGDLGEPPEPDELQDRLEQARKDIVAIWNVTQAIENGKPRLSAEDIPAPDDTEVKFEVASLGGSWIRWPHNQKTLELPPISPSDVSDLVACRLSLDALQTTWLARAPLDPHPGSDRDRQAIAKYLDPKTFFQSMRSMLTGGVIGVGGGSWDQTGQTNRNRRSQGPAWWCPTLEEILKAWGREPASLLAVDRKVNYYLDLYRQREIEEIDEDERETVVEFERVWSTVRSELLPSTSQRNER